MLMKELEGTKIKVRSRLYRYLLVAFWNKKKTEIMSTNRQAAKSVTNGIIVSNDSMTILPYNNFWKN